MSIFHQANLIKCSLAEGFFSYLFNLYFVLWESSAGSQSWRMNVPSVTGHVEFLLSLLQLSLIQSAIVQFLRVLNNPHSLIHP